MKTATCWNRVTSMAILLGVAVLTSTVFFGCAPPPEKAGGPKAGEPHKSVSEPAVKPETPANPQSPAAKSDTPAKSEEPAMLPEPAKPAPPAAKSETPAAKPEMPSIPEEPAAKPETPAQPAEAAAKPSEPAAAGDAGASVKVSAFAPAEDLANQLDDYVKDLEKAVESEQEFKDSEGKVAKEANTLIVIALTLGLHDQPNPYKANAASIVKAAQELAKGANDYESAKRGVAEVKAAVEGKGPAGGELKWEKVASIDQLMKQVPLINTKMKKYVQGSRLKSKAKDSEGLSAVIAAIGQASMADTSETKSEDQVKQWQGFCVEMRDAAGAVNAAVRAGDQSATDAAMAKLAQSCDDCHAVFHKGEKSN
jgi:hypothetical protein